MAKRDQGSFSPTGSWWSLNGDGSDAYGPYSSNGSIRAREWDNHLLLTRNNPGPPYLSGGSFLLNKKSIDPGHQFIEGRKAFHRYKGAVGMQNMPGARGPYLAIPDQLATLFALGSTAYAKARPDKPLANVAQMVGELKDYVRSGGSRSRAPSGSRDTAGNYISYEFGLKPLISDIKDLFSLQANLERKLKFLQRNNHKKIRRRIELKSETDSEQEIGEAALLSPTTILLDSYQPFTKTSTTEARYWYSGAFKFYVPEVYLPDGSWPAELVRGQSGANLSPELIYELTPWSWLADWFGSYGDAISNLSNYGVEHIVQDYGYVMGHVRKQIVWNVECRHGTPDNGSTTINIRGSASNEVKQRIHGFPYGFGNTDSDFSIRQIAILSALGLLKAS